VGCGCRCQGFHKACLLLGEGFDANSLQEGQAKETGEQSLSYNVPVSRRVRDREEKQHQTGKMTIISWTSQELAAYMAE